MTLTEWIDKRSKGCSRMTVYQELSDGSSISVQTISSIDRGMRLKTYDRAKALSELTKGAVSIAELCE